MIAAKTGYGSHQTKLASLQHVKIMDVRPVMFKGQKFVTSAEKTSSSLKMALAQVQFVRNKASRSTLTSTNVRIQFAKSINVQIA